MYIYLIPDTYLVPLGVFLDNFIKTYNTFTCSTKHRTTTINYRLKMASTTDIRNGLCFEYSNDIFSVVEFQHVKPGKGPAFVRTKMKSLTTGRILDNTFPSGHKINVVRVERRTYQYLYNDDTGYHFMEGETYEQISIDKKMIENADLLKEGSNVEILFHADKEIPLTLDMPQYITLAITYTEPGERGNTSSSNVSKPATVETGAEIKVPLFINEGDIVKIDTRTKAYVERVRK